MHVCSAVSRHLAAPGRCQGLSRWEGHWCGDMYVPWRRRGREGRGRERETPMSRGLGPSPLPTHVLQPAESSRPSSWRPPGPGGAGAGAAARTAGTGCGETRGPGRVAPSPGGEHSPSLPPSTRSHPGGSGFLQRPEIAVTPRSIPAPVSPTPHPPLPPRCRR